MNKTHEALLSAKGFLGIARAYYGAAVDPHVAKIDEALALLDAPAASGARELVLKVREGQHELDEQGNWRNNWKFSYGKAAAYVETVFAEQTRKAREEIERLRGCLSGEADLLESWANESKTGGWSTHQVEPMMRRAEHIRAAIKEAVNGKERA